MFGTKWCGGGESCPITVNFSVVVEQFFPSKSKSEFLKWKPTTFEILGSQVYDPNGTAPDKMVDALCYFLPFRNSLLYIIGNPLFVETTI